MSEEERQSTYQTGWEAGNLVALIGAYGDILFDKAANDTAAEFIRNKIRDVVDDPEVAETLCPKDYPVGTKRPCLDTGYYDHLQPAERPPRRPAQDADHRINPSGLETTDETFEFDAIVYATGFDAMTGSLVVRGRRGVGTG